MKLTEVTKAKIVLLLFILILLLLSLSGFSQTSAVKPRAISVGDTVLFCMEKQLTIALIDSYWDAKHGRVIQIELQSQVDDLEKEVTLLESISADKDTIAAKKDDIIAGADEVAKLDKKTIRKMRRKAVLAWLESKGSNIVFGATGLAAGIGIGYIIAK